jgi:hypothetical protein
MLTINQLARPRSKVNKKKEAVIAVTQTKIMLLLFLLFIRLLYSLFAYLFAGRSHVSRATLPTILRQSRHVAYERQTHFQSY